MVRARVTTPGEGGRFQGIRRRRVEVRHKLCQQGAGLERAWGALMKASVSLPLMMLLASAPALAQDPAPAVVPAEVRGLEGCWAGEGVVMDKPVTISLAARPITEGAMFLIEVQSQAKADPKDRYAAHLVFGGHGAPPSAGQATAISGYWIDSFGGDFTASGAGSAVTDGFDIAYAYPDATFVNRWRRTSDRLSWTIVAKNGAAPEARFASYDLKRTRCAARGAPK